ncbi:MAG: DMT family transporter [Silvibacterium sp.]|nr:DMT family transporter [Silvibacterium sp.]
MASTAAPTNVPTRQILGYGACALAGTFWGTGFYWGKIALTELSVGHMVLYRFLFACVGLLPVLRRPALNPREWMLLLTASFLGIPIQYLLQFYALSLTTVSHAALMVGTMPVILAVGATIFTHERLGKLGWLALAGSTCGVTLITFSSTRLRGAQGGPSLEGDLLVVVSLMLSLGWILLNRHLMQDHSPLVVTAYGVLSGTIMLTLWVFATNGPLPIRGISPRVWIASAASGLLCTASTMLLWNWGIHRVPASRAGVFLNIEPAMGSLLGVALLGDRLGSGAWVGGAMIIAAAIILTATGKTDAEVVME